ncbi:LysR family transcriptional regulator [Pelagibacterium sediminicola]|uniref:LysR family transcriptional regulator n=1 Tax=Pelagibacterium sediminicola TaxID=2248761 RepID=UPI000E31A8A7|nr:LysR family transcriptional regulator [Pelagibacterium sediminicola]
MDIAQARTFLEIAETGSFVAAASRLNVTQTAVSARIRTLEDQIGRRLFVRNKAGARLTPAGERFLRHARTLVQAWDRARAQVALPEGHTDIVSVGAELSLWNPLLVDWLGWMKREAPGIALRVEVDVAARLLEAVHSGLLDLTVLYDPPPQGPGIVVELLHEEKLVLVTTGTGDGLDDYIDIDWGPSFQASLHAAFPHLSAPGISVSHGPLAFAYLTGTGGTGYFRQSAVQPLLDERRLRRVPDAPEFSHSMYMVYSSRVEQGLTDLVRYGFRMSATGPTPAH